MKAVSQAVRGRAAAPARKLRRDAAPVLPFDVDAGKIQIPDLSSGLVSRAGLVNKLKANQTFPVVSVTAPAGYGKTTLLAQWALRDSRSFAWVSLDEQDSDPLVLLRHIAAALHGVVPLHASVLDALASPVASVWDAALPRVGSAFTARAGRVVLVLDDVHLLRSRESGELISTLAGHLGGECALVLAGRAATRLPLPALRAVGKLLEVGTDDLAMTAKEAQLLLGRCGAPSTLEEAADLVHRCEGWPAALRLYGDARATGSKEDVIADFLRSECLSRLPPTSLRFLERTSVLERMSGELCDSVLQRGGSGKELRRIERSNLFLTPLDREGSWFHYHRLFRGVLLRGLQNREPELVPLLHRRAAAWYEAHGELEPALSHAHLAGDTDHAAAIVSRIVLPAYYDGRAADVETWLEWFDDPRLLARHPLVAVIGGFIHALRGSRIEAEGWLRIAEIRLAGKSRSRRSSLVAVRAAIGAGGPDEMVADASAALSDLPPDSPLRPSALLALGTGNLLRGDSDEADAVLSSAKGEAERLGVTDVPIVAVAERSLIAAARGNHAAADRLAKEALELADRSRLEKYATSSLALAAAARAALRQGRWEEARTLLRDVRELGERGPALLPWLTGQTLIEEARAHLALRDLNSVSARLAEFDELLADEPALAALADDAGALSRDLASLPDRTDSGTAGLTAAELRLLPFLATHLSFREIGETLFVSRNTVKTEAISVYRKLGVSSRSEAVGRAVELGLIEPPTQAG
jgi:LuxR family transcriptional regulator, maltose regulon positive regulatory protein